MRAAETIPASKKAYVADLEENVLGSDLILKTRFTGLDVAKMTALRTTVREVGGGYKVVKNTLLRRAAADTPAAAIAEDLKGPVALAYTSGDPVALAKALSDFAKDTEVFEIEGGLLSGKPMSTEDVTALASLPSMEQLRAQFLGVLQAVPQKLLRVLQAPSRDLVGVLAARQRALEEGGD